MLKSIVPLSKSKFAILFTLLSVHSIASSRPLNGTIDGAGGGDFTAAEFWSQVNLVKFRLTRPVKTDPLRRGEIDSLVLLMDSRNTQLEIVDELLFVKDGQGKEKRVAAKNYPSRSEMHGSKPLIKLSRPTWQAYRAQGWELRHLILHEFLGLARISDTEYKISTAYFSPIKKPILFSLGGVRCESVGLMGHQQATGKFSIHQAMIKGKDERLISDFVPFPEPVSIYNSQSGCPECEKSQFKSVQVSFPLITEDEELVGGTNYSINVSLHLYSEQRSYGWGAAAGESYPSPARVEMTTRLIFSPPNSKKKSVLATSAAVIESHSEQGDLKISNSLFNSEFHSALENNNIQLSVHPATHPQQRSFDYTNLMNLINQWVEDQALEDSGFQSERPTSQLFPDLPKVFPLQAVVTCHLVND